MDKVPNLVLDHPTQRKDGFGQFYIIWAKGIARYKNWIHESKVWNCGQNEPTPTNAPTWMDRALIRLSFLSMCHPRLIFFYCPFSALISVFFCNFIFPRRPQILFLFLCFWKFSRPPRYYLPLSPSNLIANIFKLKVDSYPSTCSPINLKCVIFISTHLPTYPPPTPIYLSTYLPFHLLTYQHFK